MKLKLLGGISVLVLTGCAGSPLAEHDYVNISNYSNHMDKCLASGFIEPQLYAEAQTALGYVLRNRSFDLDKLKSMANASLSRTYVSVSDCKQIEVESYQLISIANERRSDRKEDLQALSSALQSMGNSLQNSSRSAMDSANSVNNQTYSYKTTPYGGGSSSSTSSGSSSGIYNTYNKNGNTITGSDGTNCFVVDNVVNCQ